MKNAQLEQLIVELKKTDVKIWRAVAKELEKPTRSRRIVNLARIDRHAKDNETVLVPGKVLAGGNLKKKVTIVAYQFSDQAQSKIDSKVMSIEDAMKENPKGKGIRILG